ncbi:unnamed protein product [Effrenium voratum]|nr:unnamed protein product [Effrenium voratum]
MGLGKTLTALVVAQIYAEEWPILIVAPTAVAPNWAKEVQRWLPHMANEVQALSSETLKKPNLSRDWCRKLISVVSYAQATRNPRLTRRPDGSPYQVVILDEAHSVKNPQTRRSQVLLPVCQDAKRCLLLTGTPVLNSASEIWTLMSALDMAIPSYDDFCVRYCKFKKVEEEDGEKYVPFGAQREDELHAAFSSYLVRKKKEEVLNLAEKRKFKVNFRDQVEGKVVQKLMVLIKKSSSKMRFRLPSKIFALTAKAKAGPVTDFVEDFMGNESAKVVIFGHHHCILDRIEAMLKQTGRQYVRLDGSVPKKMRQGRIDKFQEGDTEVALVGMKACGQGISLTAATKVIFAELYWVPATLQQAEDRVHRHGQEHGVDIIYCVLEGQPFMDDTILRKIADKERLADLITDGEATSSRFSALFKVPIRSELTS